MFVRKSKLQPRLFRVIRLLLDMFCVTVHLDNEHCRVFIRSVFGRLNGLKREFRGPLEGAWLVTPVAANAFAL